MLGWESVIAVPPMSTCSIALGVRASDMVDEEDGGSSGPVLTVLSLFPTSTISPFSKHSWNLDILARARINHHKSADRIAYSEVTIHSCIHARLHLPMPSDLLFPAFLISIINARHDMLRHHGVGGHHWAMVSALSASHGTLVTSNGAIELGGPSKK